jgi:HEAT repeat protein
VARVAAATATAAAVLIVIFCGAAAPAQPAPPPRSQEIEQFVGRDLSELDARLNDPASPQEQRDDAARRLVSRRSTAARQIIRRALIDVNPGGQLAAARALAEDPNPDPALIDSLFALIGSNRQLSEAAARALSNYKERPEVVTRLIDYVRRTRTSEATRIAVIRALGAMPQKRSAEFLVALATSRDETIAVRTAASEALSDLTGLPNGSHEPQRWAQWWSENGNKGAAEFDADLMASRAARYDQRNAQLNDLSHAMEEFIREQYRAAPQAQRSDLLLRYLRRPEPQVRAIGAVIVYEEALDAKPPSAPVREQLRSMIGDGSADVRAAVADALAKINDAESFELLLAQLAQEPNAQVRASLARALAPINDLRAVPVLIAMLDDPSQGAARAAADALRNLGKSIREDPDLARRTAAALLATLEQRAAAPETAPLRTSLIAAMVPLGQEQLLPTFTRMLDERRGETVENRFLAIRAIGEIAKPESAGLLITALEDRSAEVRREAVLALAKNPALADNAEVLARFLDPSSEPDDGVRTAAWQALSSVFPSLSKERLNIWADRFQKNNDPSRRLIVLKVLAEQQLRDRDEDGLATTRINIADQLKSQKEYAAAAEFYALALDYRKSQPNTDAARLETLIQNRMEMLLAAKDYPNAATFASQMIKENAGRGQSMGGLVWNEAQKLSNAGDLQAALALIEATRTMNPQLPEQYRENLAEVEKQVLARQNQQNGVSPAAGSRSASADAPDDVGDPAPAR